MKRLLLSMLLLAAPLLSGQTTSITTGKPNVFGETKTVIRDGSGRFWVVTQRLLSSFTK